MYRVTGLLLSIAVVALGAPSSYQADSRADTCGIVQIGNTRRSGAQSFLDKIVGGAAATPSSWPWQVGLRIQSYQLAAPTFFCGGSIIDKKWVVTAGHCCDAPRTSGLTTYTVEVLAGIHNLQNVQSSDVYTVKRMIKHNSYSMTPIQYDICVMELDRELSFGMKVQPVCVATSQWAAGTECFASGWGSINFSPVAVLRPDILQETSVSLVTEADCQRAYSMANSGLAISSFTVCAVKPGAGPCRGDSGGPLVCRRGNQWELVGVTSAVSMVGCGHPYFPTVFANVPYFVNWLSTNTGINFSS